jgi:hypothetical protein
MEFADIFRPETLIVTIAATDVPQKLHATSLRVKSVAIERLNGAGTTLIGDVTNQVLVGLTLNGNNQWIELDSIYVKGTIGDQVAVFYSRTFK